MQDERLGQGASLGSEGCIPIYTCDQEEHSVDEMLNTNSTVLNCNNLARKSYVLLHLKLAVQYPLMMCI
jgi:hypothetical protein